MATTRRQPKGPTRRQPKDRAQLEGARGQAQWEALYQAHNAIFKLAELALLSQRLSLPQFHLLSVLNKGGGLLTTGEIGEAMIKASQTITGLVDRLEEPGMVERVFDRSDRRKTWVRMTKEGERKLAEAAPVFNSLVDELFSVLTDQDLRDLQAKLEKVSSATMERLTAALARQQPSARRAF